ncbi:hypothetical protein R69927_03398 [Paraburkholderia domus]|uniref:phage tail sheath family protein n=1 Tax=Paraburkholderia domus TaxID=2793075 RepID=UPI001911ED87|nr:phage tail sheath C-terminal domain-containing protein [Paraburkholderia domus]MBK5087846.1 phage tail sheath family protein [Burkholderia sp. R-69927]CAE6697732.1 hypothetical protein R75483_00686 [Paraburkholderia domus]CAE6871170.1 hypothetical protein R69927_03398 [Paraburkholderia domus]
MSTLVTYPGVYVYETPGSAPLVSAGAPTVPVFPIPISANNQHLFDNATRVNSWADWVGKKGHQGNYTYIEDYSLKIYFENGGGPCYVVSLPSLAEQVPQFDDINLIVSAGQEIASQVNSLCQDGKGLFAILDGPKTEITSAYDPSLSYTPNPHVAIYYPWFKASWADELIPVSAAVAAIYCVTDRTRGVWKAPANFSIQGDVQPQFAVTDDLQGQFNKGLAINMIRVIDGRGPVVWGARTLDDSDNWRYIAVRRLFNSAERDIKAAMQSMVFEPNNPPTWEKVRSSVANYLHGLWRQGALAGTTEAEAYFVEIGEGVTMTADDIAQGKMIISVGMAAVRPAEFIVLQFAQSVAQG